MNRKYPITGGIIALLLISVAITATAAAATVPEYKVTYLIGLNDDGSATWQVEYRTLLSNDNDSAAFNEFSANIDAYYLPQFRDLMERSAAQAAIATSRSMTVSDFSGTSDIQISPTGKFGVILYSFTWNGFTKPGTEIVVGDAFAGGMYIAKDTTLIIRYPSEMSVKSVAPDPDSTRDGLTWYGQRSFGPGEPRIVLEEGGFPFLFLAIGLILLIAGAGVLLLVRKRGGNMNETEDPLEPAPALLSEAEIVSLQERIIQMIRANGGEMYQSEIVKNLGLPKSTVSSALNDLHARGAIVKVKKGRENLIRISS